ncbi:ammonia-forming cytochrome c nitrite reductase subunit c552 [Oleiharenicola lentus]|uniref:nitrite reductase (cytochrome; ammonia-forming) n=1 Tax=Oleiharenicola lentus TaxID=2508720 RepID=A0A4Q1C8G6_9BACT|nr:ammonia-forming cytochrome c nitrite reductase subunit c552 [Oleiharenicola lentus]RXK55188.1 ammonia-forming cytochrome c nitrite reductase subunit c552 [Oleiharenicola lentus]
MKTTPDSRQHGLATWALIAILAATAGATFLTLMLYQNIVARKAEATKDVFRVVEVSDETVDPAIWGKNYPRQYDSYRRTVDTERTNHGGSEAFQHLDKDPVWRRLFAGYAFAVDYREERGHAYMLIDQRETERVKNFKQPGACLQCHASAVDTYRKEGIKAGIPAGKEHWEEQIQKGFEVVCAMPYSEATKLVEHPVSCIDCHDAETMNLRVNRPGFLNGIRALANSDYPTPHLPSIERWRKDGRKGRYEPNSDATRQEMRSMVCAQCHVEYYFKGDKKLVTYPWDKGLKVEQIETYYNEVGHTDFKNKESGAPILKAQHPEFEMWSQGIHARSGVACADCHMPYVREGAIKVSNHHVRSPLLNVAQACQSCHRIPEQEIKARALLVQDRNAALLTRGEAAVVGLLDAIALAQKAGATDDQLKTARDLHRKAQWRLDFVAAENSMGFHAPQEAARILAEAIDYARQGEIAVAKETRPAGGGAVAGALK